MILIIFIWDIFPAISYINQGIWAFKTIKFYINIFFYKIYILYFDINTILIVFLNINKF
jgi:hypothetical protein